jgi:hypothetical protein
LWNLKYFNRHNIDFGFHLLPIYQFCFEVNGKFIKHLEQLSRYTCFAVVYHVPCTTLISLISTARIHPYFTTTYWYDSFRVAIRRHNSTYIGTYLKPTYERKMALIQFQLKSSILFVTIYSLSIIRIAVTNEQPIQSVT